MKRCFIQYPVTKIILGVFAVAFALLVPAPAHANTSWVAGGNWADDGDNFQTGVIYPTGITSSTTTAQAQAVADIIANDDKSVGINFVRIGINAATISDNWSVVQAYINELIHDGMAVDLGFWTSSSSVGTITDESSWQSMWETVDSVYSGNNSVYYEPINEPHGYASETVLGTDVYEPFLGFVSKSQNHIILDGQDTANDVTQVGADSRFTNCLLGIHIYPGWWGEYTTESGWESALSTHVGSYASRTIMTEMGAQATTGLDYGTSSDDVNVCFIRGICTEVLSLDMGMVYWPSHRAGDTYRLFNSPGTGITNPSLILELQYGWGLNASWHAWDNPGSGIPGSGKTFTSGIAACSWGANRLDIFGVGSDNQIYHNWWNGSSWQSTWEVHTMPTGITPLGAPSASANFSDNTREDLYFIGSDGNCYHKHYNSGWSGWENLGAPSGTTLVGSPAAASWYSNRFDVYVTGNNNIVYRQYWTVSSGWSGWVNQGGLTSDEPAACTWGDNRLDAYVLSSSGAIYHQFWDGSEFVPSQTTWEQDLPETTAEFGLGASSWGTGRIDLFADVGSTIVHNWYNGGWKSDWSESHTPPVRPNSAPGAASWGVNRIDVVVLGSDGKCYHLYWGL